MMQNTITVAERKYYPRLSLYRRAEHRILLSLFPSHVGKPEGLLRATAAADPDRYTTQVTDLITQVSDASLVHQTYGKYSKGTHVRQLLATLLLYEDHLARSRCWMPYPTRMLLWQHLELSQRRILHGQ